MAKGAKRRPVFGPLFASRLHGPNAESSVQTTSVEPDDNDAVAFNDGHSGFLRFALHLVSRTLIFDDVEFLKWDLPFLQW